MSSLLLTSMIQPLSMLINLSPANFKGRIKIMHTFMCFDQTTFQSTHWNLFMRTNLILLAIFCFLHFSCTFSFHFIYPLVWAAVEILLLGQFCCDNSVWIILELWLFMDQIRIPSCYRIHILPYSRQQLRICSIFIATRRLQSTEMCRRKKGEITVDDLSITTVITHCLAAEEVEEKPELPEPIEIPDIVMNKKALRDEQRRLAKVVKKEWEIL